jgi:hypothetical protein
MTDIRVSSQAASALYLSDAAPDVQVARQSVTILYSHNVPFNSVVVSDQALSVLYSCVTSNVEISNQSLLVLYLDNTSVSNDVRVSDQSLTVLYLYDITNTVEVSGQNVTALYLSDALPDFQVSGQSLTVLYSYQPENVGKLLNSPWCVLIEVVANVEGVETTHYLSDKGYVAGTFGIRKNIAYLPGIAGGVSLTEELSLDGSGGGMTYGDIEIFNVYGERDDWLNYIWDNREIKIYFGKLIWSRADFRLVFNGVVAGLQSKNRTTLNLMIRDKLQRLNCAMTTVTLGGDSDNKDALLPLTFGEVCNASPLLIDPALHVYQVHQGQIEGIIEARDNGYSIEISISRTLSAGTFSLVAAPAGTITASVQGYKSGTYYNDIANLIKIIVLNYGKVSTRFTEDDLNLDNLSDFASIHVQPVGIYLKDRINVIDVIQQLAASVGAQVIINRSGKLEILQILLPATGSPTIITPNDIVDGSLHIVNRIPVKANAKIGFCKNWTVQQQVATGVLESHAALFAKEWITVTATDSSTETLYKLDDEPIERDTLLLDRPEALAEAQREVDLYKIQRTIYGFEGFGGVDAIVDCLSLHLGDTITIINPRYGLSEGKSGIITKLTPDWINLRCGVEVLI